MQVNMTTVTKGYAVTSYCSSLKKNSF